MDVVESACGLCVEGFSCAGRKDGKYGIALIRADSPCAAVAVFTKNTVKAAPVKLMLEKMEKGLLQAIVANSGNANACVRGGDADAKEMCRMAAEAFGVPVDLVGVASTGIIGRRMDLGKISSLVTELAPKMASNPQASRDAARAIMTTDTKEKNVSFRLGEVEIGGICKGAGMIAPNMATMLCFLSTNADVDRKEMQRILSGAVEDTFNMLVVDTDTSTNDSVVLMSSRRKKCSSADFEKLLRHTLMQLTNLLAEDAEGATKKIEAVVSGAKDKETARIAAKAIVSSPLVKTAVYGENPNWGRIVAALGRSIEVDFEKMDVAYEAAGKRVYVVRNGEGLDIKPAEEVLKNAEIRILVDLHEGGAEATAWGCDMTEEYIRINAEYN